MNNPANPEYHSKDKELLVLFRIISRRSWDELQNWQRALPGSHVEHLMHGLYVLTVVPRGARRLEA